eukprot:TCONS_00069283-protein
MYVVVPRPRVFFLHRPTQYSVVFSFEYFLLEVLNFRFARTQSHFIMPSRSTSSKKTTMPDNERSTNDLGKLTVTELKNKLKHLKLPEEGRKSDLQQRLFNHYHPPSNPTTANIQLADILHEFQTLRTEVNSLKNKQTSQP